MSEIRLFAGDFAPKTWSMCNGSLLAINTNQALFALLGTTYGGDGRATFGLPDLRGRSAVGTGQGAGLSYYALGQMGGTNTVSLLASQMPAHTHTATTGASTGQSGGTALLTAVNAGGQASPTGNYLGVDDSGTGASTYATGGTGTPVAMNSASLVTSNGLVSAPSVAVAMNGASQPHSNTMPSLALNYIICIYGIFPSRN